MYGMLQRAVVENVRILFKQESRMAYSTADEAL